MQFDIITIFPNIFESYFNESIIKRAQENKKIKINIINLRDFATDKHKTVDDKPYGGGPGMVLKIEPLVRAINSILKLKKDNGKKGAGHTLTSAAAKVKVILFSAAGNQFNAKMAAGWVKKYDRIIMIAGHYEGVDERIFDVLKAKSYKLEAISVGPYILTGGELPAMIVADAISRHIPGVLGKEESLEEKRFGIGVPVYTRPELFTFNGKTVKVPKVLLSGNHKEIAAWRERHGKGR